jgi:hypothetical protein
METSADNNGPGRPPVSPALFYAVAALIIAAGVWHAAQLATVNDDSFISFRYARQLVDGNGLVYNPGERVEGYTNFLWTVILAGGMRFGADPVVLSIVLGIAFFAGTLLLLSLLSRRLIAEGGGILPMLPLAAIALVLHRDAGVYATSGLETSMQAFLVTALFATLVLRDDARGCLFAGLILTASLMTRPDAAIYGAAVAAFILIERKEIVRRLVAFALPLLLLFLPYWIIRWRYYGFFFPNAFYAKSIDLPYYGQGLTYAWMYVSSYYPLLAVPAVAVASYVIRGRRRANGGPAAAPAPAIRDRPAFPPSPAFPAPPAGAPTSAPCASASFSPVCLRSSSSGSAAISCSRGSSSRSPRSPACCSNSWSGGHRPPGWRTASRSSSSRVRRTGTIIFR